MNLIESANYFLEEESSLPNENSLGNPIAQTEDALKNFWNWFGNSKVVDDKGRPVVMFHGTNMEFDSFKENDRGLYFVSPSSEWVSKFIGDVESSSIIPLYVSAANPFDYENSTHIKKLSIGASLGALAISELKKGNWVRVEDRTTVQTIKSLGFDGLYVKEHGVKNLAVFSPIQMKSVIGNKGTFDLSSNKLTEDC